MGLLTSRMEGNRKLGVRAPIWIFWRDLQITVWGSLKPVPTELGLELAGQHLLRAHRALGNSLKEGRSGG